MNQLHAEMLRVTGRVVDELRLTTREAVNESALIVTQDARRRTRAVLGPEQRVSRVTRRKRNDKGGRVTKVSAETVAKGGTKINPAYKPASSATNPVAIVGARGPAHLIEHKRRGGYVVKPLRAVFDAEQADAVATLEAQLFGRKAAEQRRAGERLTHPPALVIGGVYRGAVRPGPITRPLAPITAAFDAAPRTIAVKARDNVETGMRRRLGLAVK